MFKKLLKQLIFIIVCVCLLSDIPGVFAAAVQQSADNVTAMVLANADSSRILSSSNGNIRMPTGTLSKIMTALIVAEHIESGEISPETPVTASANAQSAKGAVVWLTAGEKMSVSDLLLSMMTGNANDASIALAEKIAGNEQAFVALMNEKAQSLSMNDTYYGNCTGLDDGVSYSTANDIAVLCCELVKHEFLYQYMTPWLTYIRDGETELVNFNDLVKSLNGIIGIKASKTESSQYCAAVAAKRDNECYVAVCLNFSDKDECLKSGKSLISTGFSAYKTIYPLIDATQLGDVSVKGGVQKNVSVSADIKPICIPSTDESLISSVAVLPDYVSAPVKKGQTLGTLAIYADDVPICELDICAEYDVNEESLLTAFLSLLETLLN